MTVCPLMDRNWNGFRGSGMKVLFSGCSVKEEAITPFTHAFSRPDKRCICSWKVFLFFFFFKYKYDNLNLILESGAMMPNLAA